MDACGPWRVGLNRALISKAPAADINLCWGANVTAGWTQGNEACLGGRQALAVNRSAGVGPRARATVAELIETWREED